MGELPKKLKSKLAERLTNNALRKLPTSNNLIDFSSNDYLGISREQAVHDRAQQILERRKLYPHGATGSRLLTGNHMLYQELELMLSKHHVAESALVFNSGYDANIGFFSSVPQRDDIVLYDELVHASIRDGIRMGVAKSYKFGHNDLNQLQERLSTLFRHRKKSKTIEVYVVTESVFSMDGDTPDMKALAEFCWKNGLHLVVDEAHATGIFGSGRDMVCALGLQEKVFARVITFGKAMGCHGAAILGNEALKNYLVNFARSLIYTTAQAPMSLASIMASYHYVKENGEGARAGLNQNIEHFKAEVERLQMAESFIESGSAIHCLVVAGNERAKALSTHLMTEGFDVKPILSPTVKLGEERLRFCLHSYNTKEEISRVLRLVKGELD